MDCLRAVGGVLPVRAPGPMVFPDAVSARPQWASFIVSELVGGVNRLADADGFSGPTEVLARPSIKPQRDSVSPTSLIAKLAKRNPAIARWVSGLVFRCAG